MFRTEEQLLDLVIAALQSIAAYPDTDSLRELQAVVRQRLAIIPVPRYHPGPIDVSTMGGFPQRFPPPPEAPDRGWDGLTGPVDAGQDCTDWCVLSLCPLCQIETTHCLCWVVFTGVTTDADGRPLCFQYQITGI